MDESSKFRKSWTVEIQIGAVTCDFQQCGILTTVDSDESVQPPTLGLEIPNGFQSVAEHS